MSEIKLVDLPKIADPRGNLSFIQRDGQVPFEIKRCYWIYDVPGGHARQGRALKSTWELIVPLSGSFDVRLDGGVSVHLCRGNKGLLVPPMHWREIENFSTNSVAAVLASTIYDEADYIRDYGEWLATEPPAVAAASPCATKKKLGGQASLDQCRIIDLPRHEDPDGSLTEVENTEAFPLDIKRIFYLYDVPAGSERGGHAHHQARELIVAVSGAFTVRLSDGKHTRAFHLDRPFQALYVDRGVWRTLDDFSAGAVCLVLTSEEFSEEDYIRDFDEYRDMADAASTVPFLDLEAVNSSYMPEILPRLERVAVCGPYVGGEEVRALEAELAVMAHTDYAIGVSNGLDALRLILRAYVQLGRMNRGDEVIVPANTYVASVLAITDAGLRPVLADVSPITYNLDTSKLESYLTPRTRAVMTVHLYGRACWDANLAEFARKHDLIVVEDNAQAIGARAVYPGIYGNHTTGGLGHAAAFSFYPTKNIGAMGDAGAVTTCDRALADAVRALANYGSDRRYHNIYAGFNCRLDPMQAAVISVKLQHLREVSEYRRMLADIYDKEIDNPLVIKPEIPVAAEEHVWHQYVVRVTDRETFWEFMDRKGIMIDVNYPINPAHQPCYSLEYGNVYAPVADMLAEQVVSLPLNTALTPSQARRIASAVNTWTKFAY